MDLPIPRDYIDLKRARDTPNGKLISVIGSVVDVRSPSQARTGQWFVTVKLLDLRMRNDPSNSQGLKVRFFDPNKDKMPMIRHVGDVVLLRNVKRMLRDGEQIVVTNHATSTIVFPEAAIPNPNYTVAYMGGGRLQAHGAPGDIEKLTPEEQRYVIALHHSLLDHVAALPAPTPLPTAPAVQPNPISAAPSKGKTQNTRSEYFGAKFKLIQHVNHLQFADVVVEVVKKFEGPNKVELYVTDYTENKNVWLYTPPEDESEAQRTYDGDPYSYTNLSKKEWKGPWGQRILKVNVMEPHAAFARTSVREGQIVVLKNMKVKAMDGAKLEGDLWPDATNPDRIQIQNLATAGKNTPEYTALKSRKEQYWIKRENVLNAQASAKMDASKQNETAAPAGTKTKAQLKKERKKERQRLANEAELAENSILEEAVRDNNRIIEEARANGSDILTSASKPVSTITLNKHIRTANPGTPTMSVRDILDPDNIRHRIRHDGKDYAAPFVNHRYRAKVRVVGYFPDIEDFAMPPATKTADGELVDNPSPGDQQQFEWFFELLCEDASIPSAVKTEKQQISLALQHEDAQFLLGNDMPDPADLRANPQLLAKLKEKLCILWGNLEEKSEEEELNNLPFVCNIKEWGCMLDEDDPDILDVQNLGWKRCYGICDTTIL